MNRRTKFVAVATAFAVVSGGGVAYALWSANGTGPGQTKALTAQSITVTAVTATADLYPGFTLGDVFFTMTNPNPYPVTMTSMAAGTITSSSPGTCPSANLTVAAASGLSLAVGANATSSTQSIVDVASMVVGAPDGCQGVTFSIALTLSGTQS